MKKKKQIEGHMRTGWVFVSALTLQNARVNDFSGHGVIFDPKEVPGHSLPIPMQERTGVPRSEETAVQGCLAHKKPPLSPYSRDTPRHL